MEGKILAIIPKKLDISENSIFFNKKPIRQTHFAVKQLYIWQKR